MKKTNLTVLGCGNMAQAIIRALFDTQTPSSAAEELNVRVVVSDIDEQKLAQLQAPVQKTSDNAQAIQNADCVLLAVKPQSAADMLRPLDLRNKTILSIMAGTSIDTLQRLTKSEKIVRIMPNLNARIFRSFNAYACTGIDEDEKSFVHKLLSSFGVAMQVDESQLDAVTGMTGSSPAFVFLLIKAFIEEGISLGFSPDTARQMALSTLIGSAELVRSDENTDLDALIDSVCSKGGTTIEGVRYLRAQNFEEIFRTSIEKAVARAKELSAAK